MNDNSSQPSSKLVGWIVGLVVMLLLVVCSAFALYKFVWQEQRNVAVESVPITPPTVKDRIRDSFAQRNVPQAQPASAFSVSPSPSGRIRARHGGVVVSGIPKKDGGYDAVLEYEDARSWVTPAQWENQILAGRPRQYPALAQKIEITSDQQAKIEALTYQPVLSDAEKKDFDKLFVNWHKAPQKDKDAAAEELSNAVQNASQKHLAEAKAALLKRCAEVTTILSPQQMQQIKEFFNSPSPRAGTANLR